MTPVFEDSPEGFVARWRGYSVDAEVFAKTEGNPLIECRIGESVLQLFERTGPYLSKAGEARLIINPTVDRLEPSAFELTPSLDVGAVSTVAASGTVLEVDGRTAVIDAGVPLVVYSLEPLPEHLVKGVAVRFESHAPVHGFVVPSQQRRNNTRGSDDDI